MNSPVGASRQSWFARNRMTLLTVAIVAAYALFIEWFWGWSAIIAQWAAVGVIPILVALMLADQHLFPADMAHSRLLPAGDGRSVSHSFPSDADS